MDLHDFDDVAENYDLYLGEMFKDEDNNEEFLEFYGSSLKPVGKN